MNRKQVRVRVVYYIFSLIFCASSLIFSQDEQPYPPLDLVTIPTSGTLPKGSFTLESLLMKDGGILPKLSVGITDNFYIGLSYGVQDFVGDKQMSVNKATPEVQIKYRLYSETETIPAIVVGLDTQGKGRFLDKEELSLDNSYSEYQRYEQKAWGVYFVASKNWNLFGNLGLHVGVNKNSWESDPYQYSGETIFKDKDLNLFFGIDTTIVSIFLHNFTLS